jgi:hypothetical protein
VVLRCTQPWRNGERFYPYGATIAWDHVGDDEMNFYLHGFVNQPYPGIYSSYLTLPKHSFARVSKVERRES